MNNLPELLLLDEERELGMDTTSADSGDKQWITTGWRARSADGDVFFHHKELTIVEQWLAGQGYVDTGDGVHYQR